MPEISLTQTPAHVRHGSNIGQPLTRREGVLKVKGEARYAADNHPAGMLHAVLGVSSIARGRVSFLDVQAAKSHPGVIEVMTPANRPALAEDPDAKTNPFMFRLDLLQNDQRRYALDRYAKPRPRHSPGAACGTLRHFAREDPYSQSFFGWRLRLKRPDLRATGARHSGGPVGWQAGETRAPP